MPAFAAAFRADPKQIIADQRQAQEHIGSAVTLRVRREQGTAVALEASCATPRQVADVIAYVNGVGPYRYRPDIVRNPDGGGTKVTLWPVQQHATQQPR